jgi:hypothetical protein
MLAFKRLLRGAVLLLLSSHVTTLCSHMVVLVLARLLFCLSNATRYVRTRAGLCVYTYGAC